MSKHFLDSILLQIFNMADMHWVKCLYKWLWMLHSYDWSFTSRKPKPGPVLILVLVSMWTQPNAEWYSSGSVVGVFTIDLVELNLNATTFYFYKCQFLVSVKMAWWVLGFWWLLWTQMYWKFAYLHLSFIYDTQRYANVFWLIDLGDWIPMPI